MRQELLRNLGRDTIIIYTDGYGSNTIMTMEKAYVEAVLREGGTPPVIDYKLNNGVFYW